MGQQGQQDQEACHNKDFESKLREPHEDTWVIRYTNTYKIVCRYSKIVKSGNKYLYCKETYHGG